MSSVSIQRSPIASVNEEEAVGALVCAYTLLLVPAAILAFPSANVITELLDDKSIPANAVADIWLAAEICTVLFEERLRLFTALTDIWFAEVIRTVLLPDRLILLAITLKAESVNVIFEAEVPLWIIQFILLAVCDTADKPVDES